MLKKRSCNDFVNSDLDINHCFKKYKPVMSNNNAKDNGNCYPLSYNLPINNTYQNFLLNNNENSEHHKNKQQHKLPPIVTQLNSSQIRDVMKRLKVSKFDMKLTSVGLKVTIYEKTHYTQLSEELKKNNAEFFSFTQDENKTSRYVLFGLPSMPTEEVETYIKEAGLSPSRITKVLRKESRINDSAMYFVSFPKATTLNQLKNHRFIGHIACTWDIPHKKPERLTQCLKCFRLGHTSGNCNMKPRCGYCSQAHMDDEECQFKTVVTKHLCANCSGNHTANSIFCPKRMEFLQIREQINKRIQPKSSQPFNWGAAAFPSLLTPEDHQFIQPSNMEAATPQIQWSNLFKSNISPTAQQSEIPNSSKLYSSSELLLILENVMDGLRRCRTPAEQVQVILATAIQYVCK